MNKLSMLILATSLVTTSALAQNTGFSGPGAVAPETAATTVKNSGFTGPNASVTTVAKALTMADDSWITLQGHIEQQIDKKHYIFRDETGTIHIEIDQKHWNGLSVSPTDRIEIQGEIDKDWNSIELEVKKITKIQ